MKRSLKKTFAAVLSAAVMFSSITPVNVLAAPSDDCMHTRKNVNAEAGTDCNTQGTIAHWHCDECSKDFDAEIGGNVLSEDDLKGEFGAHTLGSLVAGEAGTDCEHEGTVDHYTCSTCNKNFADDQAAEELDSISDGTFG
ncbi:MAG: hypothetical protein NC240_03165, partial [Clostridium sp.]|nr:hypothetical protein [Clostridium sp.]